MALQPRSAKRPSPDWFILDNERARGVPMWVAQIFPSIINWRRSFSEGSQASGRAPDQRDGYRALVL